MGNKVYIILINYNGYNDTIECVDSLKVITQTKFKIIVVDNKSTDNSFERLKRNLDKDVILIEAESNNGFSAGNNIGIKYAMEHGAKYVLLLNNDTIINEDFLTPMLEFSKKNNNCGCISCRINYNDERNKIWYDGGNFNYYFCRTDHNNFNKEYSKYTGFNETKFVSGCCMLLPINVIEKIGLMDERYFLYVEDTEYCLRIKQNGYKLYWDSNHKIYHKVSSSTKYISRAAQFYEIRNRLLLKKTYLNPFQKITSFIYDIVFYSYKLITRKYDFSILIKAISYYKKRKYGMVDKI